MFRPNNPRLRALSQKYFRPNVSRQGPVMPIREIKRIVIGPQNFAVYDQNEPSVFQTPDPQLKKTLTETQVCILDNCWAATVQKNMRKPSSILNSLSYYFYNVNEKLQTMTDQIEKLEKSKFQYYVLYKGSKLVYTKHGKKLWSTPKIT